MAFENQTHLHRSCLEPRQKIEITPSSAKDWYDAAILAFKAKDCKVAIRFITKAIQLEPKNSIYHNFVGVIFRKLNKNKNSENAYKKAIELDPNNLEAHHNLGSLYFEIGLNEKSQTHFDNALKIDPQYCPTLNAKGLLNLQAGQLNEAKTLFTKALSLKPDFDKAILNLGDLHIHLNQPRVALRWYEKFIKLNELSNEILLKQARAYYDLGNLEKCEEHCKRALNEQPDIALGNAILGQCYEKKGQYELAQQYFEKVQIAEKTQSANTLCSIGMVFFEQVKDYNKAKEQFLKAIELAPEFILAHLNLANVYVILGEVNEAEKVLNRVLEISPSQPQAYRQLAHIKKTQVFDESNIEELENRLKDNEQDDLVQIDLRYALADCLDQKQDYDRAFQHLKTANDLNSKSSTFHYDKVKEQSQKNLAFFTAEKIEELSQNGHASECPVFIVGMPRSGTTLTEQILSSHPSIFGAGELQEIATIRTKLHSDAEQPFPNLLNDIDGDAFYKTAQNHINYLQQLAPEASRVIDKMPFNFHFIGLILSLYPNAKIIHSSRHPLDTCLSCYFMKFSSRMSFSNDLNHLGKMHQLQDEIMDYWKCMMPENIYTQSYENLVNHTEEETRKLLNFLDLDWNDSCLMHHENQRPVKTASNWQVRQPIYKTSVGRYKNYKKHLQPIADILNLDLD